MNTREQLDALQHCFDWNSDEYESILSLIEQAEKEERKTVLDELMAFNNIT